MRLQDGYLREIWASAFRRWWPITFAEGMHVTLQSENGMLGIEAFPVRG